MFTTFSEATSHLKQQLNLLMPNDPFEEEEVREMLFDAIFTKIDDDDLDKVFSGKNQELLEQNKLSEADIITLMENRVPNFKKVMTDLVQEIYEEYKHEA